MINLTCRGCSAYKETILILQNQIEYIKKLHDFERSEGRRGMDARLVDAGKTPVGQGISPSERDPEPQQPVDMDAALKVFEDRGPFVASNS